VPPELTETGEEIRAVPATPRPARRGIRRVHILARVAIGVVLGVLVLAIALDLGTASPRVCSSCHEIVPRAESWSVSAHSTVACVKCHQPPTAWYELSKRMVDRGRLLWRDVAAHRSGDYDDPVDAAEIGAEPVSDDVCLQCHDPNRKATSGFRILIDHAEHAKRNGSCISCHVRTAHPIESRGTPMSLMSQCFTCHGTPGQPEASAECGVCHPADYELLPGSHEETTWAVGHGDVQQSDPKQCAMCHTQTFCDDCHGLAMPHPTNWAKGPSGHGALAESDRALCGRCHGGDRPDLCTMCHHTSYDPTVGTWIEQHPVEVQDEGVAYCEGCHPGPYCSFCHTKLVEGEAE
jgi:nitrate/TMAO reductase-like tetraheme cytochrome c subunit